MLLTKHFRFSLDKGAQTQVWLLPTGMGYGVTWERGELGVGGLTLSERCGYRCIRFAVILETSGKLVLAQTTGVTCKMGGVKIGSGDC